jgi:putative ABC transport system ATP-binding protein
MFVRLEHIHKIYNQGEPNEVHALSDVTLDIAKGEMICIRGPSGSGKTTLLSIIGCVMVPTSGHASIGGKKLSRMPDHFLTRYRRETVGFVFQHFQLLPYLSVIDNITLPLLVLGESPAERKRKGDQLLARYDMLPRRNFLCRHLSGGELQRTALARALINDPPLIVADEPTAHLDTSLARSVVDMLTELKQEGKTIVVTSHDSRVTDHPGVDRLVDIKDGRLDGLPAREEPCC